MTDQHEIFPSKQDSWQSYLNIARHLGCDVDVVDRCFSKLPVPEWSTGEHLDALKANALALNDAAIHAHNLRQALERLSQGDRDILIQAACPTVFQIGRLATVLEGDGEVFMRWASEHSRKGGRNPAAHIIARGIRQVYRKLGWPITFGQVSGQPSTSFGRAVQFAIGEFGVQADWKNPASKQFQWDQRARQRLANCRLKYLRHESTQLADDVAVEHVSENKEESWVFTLKGRRDVPPLRLPDKKFSSGQEVVRFANEWAETFRDKR